MARTSKAATLAALLATDTATATVARDPIIAEMAAEHGVTVPPVKKNAVKTAPVAPVPTAPAVLTVPSFKLTFIAGALTATVKTPTSRATTNPWYPVIEWIDGQAPGFLKIERTADGVKSPVAQIKSARNRALDLGVKSAGKLTVASSATEKGVWYLVKR